MNGTFSARLTREGARARTGRLSQQDKKLDRSNCLLPRRFQEQQCSPRQPEKMQTPAASLSPSKADPPAGKDDIKKKRPIFGSLAKIVAEEFAKHTVATLQAGLNNMPASDSFEPMHQYVESRYLEAVDVFEICIHRSVFNPHFIQDMQQRERVAEIYHTAIDAQTIREAIIRQRQQQVEEEHQQRVKDAEDNPGKKDDSLPEVQPTEDDLDKLKKKIKQLSLHKDELDKQRTRLQSRTKTIESCDTLLQDMEQTTESTTDSANVERVRAMLLQAQTANRLGDKAEEYQKDIEENRKRKGNNGNGLAVVPKQQQRKKRASFGTRYNNSVAKVDPNALLAIMSKIFDDKK
jgi:hypothetical protein